MSRGTLLAGDGNDEIYCDYNASGASIFLSEGGAIDMGRGNDKVTGFNGTGLSAHIAKGAFVATGEGDDSVDFLAGGVALGTAGYGMEKHLDLGSGNDSAYLNINKSRALGKSSEVGGYFSGGEGEDTLYLPEGYYKIAKVAESQDAYSFSFSDGSHFIVNSFERLGNAISGSTSSIRDGNVYVIDNGLFLRNADGDFVAY